MSPILQEPLPYLEDGLLPHISSNTLSFHYGKHHKAYIEKTNYLMKVHHLEELPLEEVMRRSAEHPDMKSLFENAAQAWNHAFYWRSMKPGGGGKPGAEILNLLKSSFESFEEFKKQFESVAVSHFGSGWIWLVKEKNQLKIVSAHDADNPLIHHQQPLIACDIWEHAYYLDYQNKRAEYVKVFLTHLVNWDFAENQLYFCHDSLSSLGV